LRIEQSFLFFSTFEHEMEDDNPEKPFACYPLNGKILNFKDARAVATK
jgi:hypothetical protein